MGLNLEAFDKSKHNYLQKCFYVINLMKDKDYDLWENFHAQYCSTTPDESHELYAILVEEYRKMIAPPKKRAVRTAKKTRAKKAA
jgi:hypothetical protein